jgi:GT2 family glycosyltransferase
MYSSVKNLPVSIIVPNYNGADVIRSSLAAVDAAARAYPGECAVVVVDDASQDDSLKLIAAHFPEFKVVAHTRNKGFAEAIHSGVRVSSHPIVVLLNTDVFPDRDFLLPLIQWFHHPDTFSVSPLITDRNGQPGRVSWNRGKIVRGELRKTNWDLETALNFVQPGAGLKSLYAQGGAAAYRKEMFLKLGGFLPIFKPFYYEDCDLGIRAWQRGWQTYFEPASTVVHDHRQGTISRFFAANKIKIIKKRNRFYYLWLHLSWQTLVLAHFPWILVRLLGRLVRLDVSFVFGFFAALPAFVQVMKLRKQYGPAATGKSLEDILSEIGT